MRSKTIWNRLDEILDRYRVAIGLVLISLIVASGVAWLGFDFFSQKKDTERSDLAQEIRKLEAKNAQLNQQLSELEEKHNRLVAEWKDFSDHFSKLEPDRLTVGQRVKGAQNQRKARSAAQHTTSHLVNLNTATKNKLESLPGIGSVYAQRIIDYREMNGGFKSVEELTNVKGIGPKTLEKLRDKITI